MVVFSNEEWDNVVKCNPMGREMYWPPLMTYEEALSSLSSLSEL
jgi:hypothetical protein